MILLETQVYAIECTETHLPKGFVYLDEIDPTIDQKLEFATEEKNLGVPADGYETGRAICTKEAAHALVKIQKKLKKEGLCLRICDAYRPARAVEHIKRWAKDLNDQKTKARYYPHIPKEEILGTFVAANRSSHSRGSTVDVILVEDITKEPLDFWADGFVEESYTYCSQLTKEQQQNRLKLRKIMLAYGFKPYNKEYWHFTLKNEPFPETYFDFPVR